MNPVDPYDLAAKLGVDISEEGMLRAALDRLMDSSPTCRHCDAVLQMVIPRGGTRAFTMVVHDADCPDAAA